MCYSLFFTFSWALLPRQPGLCKALRDCSMIQLRYMSSHAALESISWANDNYPGGSATPITFLSPYQADGSFPLVTYCQRQPLGSGHSQTEGFCCDCLLMKTLMHSRVWDGDQCAKLIFDQMYLFVVDLIQIPSCSKYLVQYSCQSCF